MLITSRTFSKSVYSLSTSYRRLSSFVYVLKVKSIFSTLKSIMLINDYIVNIHVGRNI